MDLHKFMETMWPWLFKSLQEDYMYVTPDVCMDSWSHAATPTCYKLPSHTVLCIQRLQAMMWCSSPTSLLRLLCLSLLLHIWTKPTVLLLMSSEISGCILCGSCLLNLCHLGAGWYEKTIDVLHWYSKISYFVASIKFVSWSGLYIFTAPKTVQQDTQIATKLLQVCMPRREVITVGRRRSGDQLPLHCLTSRLLRQSAVQLLFELHLHTTSEAAFLFTGCGF